MYGKNKVTCQAVSYSGCTVHPHHQCMRVPASPWPCSHALVSVFVLFWPFYRRFSLMTKDVAHHFHVFICHLYIFSGEVSVQIFCLFLNWDVCFLTAKCGEFFIYLRHKSFVRYAICKYVLSEWLVLSFSYCAFQRAEVNFDEIQFIF